MGIKYRRHNLDAMYDIEYTIATSSLGKGVFVNEILSFIKVCEATEIRLLSNYNGNIFLNSFYMVLKRETTKEKLNEFIKICEEYLCMISNFIEQITLEEDSYESQEVYIFRVSYNDFFMVEDLSIDTISMIYNILTIEIDMLCRKKGFFYFKKDTYEKLHESTLIINKISKISEKIITNRKKKKNTTCLY